MLTDSLENTPLVDILNKKGNKNSTKTYKHIEITSNEDVFYE